MDEEVRVTTQAEVFDDHFESHEFLSPGGRLFERIISECLTDGEIGKPAVDGRVWLVQAGKTGSCRILARRGGRIVQCNSLADLLEAVSDDSSAGPLDTSLLSPTEEAIALLSRNNGHESRAAVA